MIGAVEGIETECLRSLCDGELLCIGEAHLSLNHDADLHAATLARGDSTRGEEYDRCNVNYRSLWQRRESGGSHGNRTTQSFTPE